SSVVAAALGEAGQARGGADVFIFHVDAYRVQTLGVVGAGGGADDGEAVVLGRVHAQAHIGGHTEGADIQRSAVRVGDPVAVHVHKGLDSLDEILRRDGGHTQTVGG